MLIRYVLVVNLDFKFELLFVGYFWFCASGMSTLSSLDILNVLFKTSELEEWIP